VSGYWIAAVLALWVVVIIEAVLLAGLLRRGTGVLEALEQSVSAKLGLVFTGAPTGTRLPPFEVSGIDGVGVASTEIFGSPCVVLLVSEGCDPCEDLIAELLATPDTERPGLLTILADSTTILEKVRALPDVRAFAQSDGAASRAFQSIATPHAFAVESGGVVTASIVPGSIVDLYRMSRMLTEREEALSHS
jgi:hypothetical protein